MKNLQQISELHIEQEHQNTDQDHHNTILAMITHDLKSPMTAIIGATEHLMGQPQARDAQGECIENLKIIHSASKDMLELIGNILTMARIEIGKERIEPVRIDDLGYMLDTILKTFSYEARINNIKLTNNIETNLPDVYWDKNKIQYHVINNIISNSLKFTPLGGEIQIRAYTEETRIIIHIQDNGPGIPVQDRKKIFDHFEKLHTSSQRTCNSNGLGLYNAHLFTCKHNGTIEITKGIAGVGVGFKISLPPHPYYNYKQ